MYLLKLTEKEILLINKIDSPENLINYLNNSIDSRLCIIKDLYSNDSNLQANTNFIIFAGDNAGNLEEY